MELFKPYKDSSRCQSRCEMADSKENLRLMKTLDDAWNWSWKPSLGDIQEASYRGCRSLLARPTRAYKRTA